MKKEVVMTLGLFFIFQNIFVKEPIVTKERIPITQQKPEITAYQLFVTIKELLYEFTILPFWLNMDKARSAQVYCDFCKRSVDSFITYGDLIARGQDHKIWVLKRLWHKHEISKIEQFICHVRNELQIPCIPCLAFCGWHCKNALQM